MRFDFLRPETVAALGANSFVYPQQFILGASPDGVTPVTDGSGPIAINGFHFFTERVAIAFPTVYLGEISNAPATIDDGVCRQTLQLSTGTINALFNNPVLLSLIGVPGRQNYFGAVLPSGGADVPPGSAPHIDGFAFNAFLAAGSSFLHNFTNTAGVAVTIDVAWTGWNIPADVCPDVRTFWEIVKRYQPAPIGR